MFKFTIPVTDVTVVRRSGGTDRIIFDTSAEHGELVHAEKLPIFGSAHYQIEVTRGRAEEVLKSLGIPQDMVKIVGG